MFGTRGYLQIIPACKSAADFVGVINAASLLALSISCAVQFPLPAPAMPANKEMRLSTVCWGNGVFNPLGLGQAVNGTCLAFNRLAWPRIRKKRVCLASLPVHFATGIRSGQE